MLLKFNVIAFNVVVFLVLAIFYFLMVIFINKFFDLEEKLSLVLIFHILTSLGSSIGRTFRISGSPILLARYYEKGWLYCYCCYWLVYHLYSNKKKN